MLQRLPDLRLSRAVPFIRHTSIRNSSTRLLGGLSKPRLPKVRLTLRLDLDDPRPFAEPLRFFFYLLMAVALLAFFVGATGSGVVMLIAGAAAYVAGSALEELAAQRRTRRERSERKRQVRLRSHRAASRARAAAEVRVPASPRVAPTRRAPVAQPGASSARKQRVV